MTKGSVTTSSVKRKCLFSMFKKEDIVPRMPPALHSLQPVVALLLSAQSTTVLQYEVALLYRLGGDYPVPNSIINVDAF